MDTGVLYIAAGDQYIGEALESAASLKQVSSLPVTLISDIPINSTYVDENLVREFEGTVHGVEYNPKFYKILNIHELPYQRTLFLDTDTYIYEDISTIYSWLDEFDMAIAHAPHRNSLQGPPDGDRKLGGNVPDCFPDHNGGVLLLDDNERVSTLIEGWRKHYFANLDVTDREQPALRRALFKSDVRFATLPPKYNHRYYKPCYVEGTIRIFHGRVFDVESVAEKLNQTKEARVSIVKRGAVQIEVMGQTKVDRAFAAVRNNSFPVLLKKVLGRIGRVLHGERDF